MLEMSEGRSNTMATESIEQLKARLKREDEAKEEAFQKRLQEIRESQAEFRAEREAKERAEHKERQELHEELRQKREQEMKDSARVGWFDAGGTGEEFEREWPAMRTQMLRECALSRGSEARREAFERNVKAF
jgi:hypothetical protein